MAISLFYFIVAKFKSDWFDWFLGVAGVTCYFTCHAIYAVQYKELNNEVNTYLYTATYFCFLLFAFAARSEKDDS